MAWEAEELVKAQLAGPEVPEGICLSQPCPARWFAAGGDRVSVHEALLPASLVLAARA